jgi:hypothetical protein
MLIMCVQVNIMHLNVRATYVHVCVCVYIDITYWMVKTHRCVWLCVHTHIHGEIYAEIENKRLYVSMYVCM